MSLLLSTESKLSDGFLAIRIFSLLAYNIHKMLEIFQITLYDPEAISLSEGKTAQRCDWKAASDSEMWLKVGVTRFALCLFHDACPTLLIFMNSFCLNVKINEDILMLKKIYSFKRNKDLNCNKDFYKALWWNLSFITWVIMFSYTVWCFL